MSSPEAFNTGDETDVQETATAPLDEDDSIELEAEADEPASDFPLPHDWDDWQLEDDLQAVQRRLHSLGVTDAVLPERANSESPQLGPARRADAVHANASSTAGQRPMSRKRKPRAAFISWIMITLGLMTFVCGAVLLGWSLYSGRGVLWNFGLPLTLGGQAALIVGLVLQLDGLWQTNRETSSTLDELDEQLDEIKRATTLLGTTHSSAARSFYVHMAEGASPQMLLADLKGQLDMLAVRMSQERR